MKSSRTDWLRPPRRWLPALGCVLVAVATASVGLGDEGYVSTFGDMPRYLMNGAFIFDLLRDRPFGSIDSVIEYARFYYARYPALSIGHHPILVSAADAPSFALFGVSVVAGRLPVIAFFAIGTLYLYRVVAEWYDEWAGAAAGLALATSPLLVELSQGVMSEPPAVALLIVATYYLHRYCTDGSRRALVAFVLCAGASVWAKQNAVALLPAFAIYLAAHVGLRRLFARDLLIAGAALAAIVAPLIPLTLAMSPHNVSIVRYGTTAAASGENWQIVRELAHALTVQFVGPLAFVAVLGAIVMVGRRRSEAWLVVPSIACVAALILLGTRFTQVERYSIFWLPAWATAIGALVGLVRARPWRVSVLILVAAVLGLQGWTAARVRLSGAGGYEAAAKYVVDHPHGSTVLFCGDVDSGFFVFFMRKHDVERRWVVLRADKEFTTSQLLESAIEDRIDSPEAIRPTLAQLGVGYVVVEDRPSESTVLNWVRSELKSDAFVEQLRVSFESVDRRLRGNDLLVYKVRNVTAPAPGARVNARLPVVSAEVDVALADLMARKYLR
jgi:hypothetical protein